MDWIWYVNLLLTSVSELVSVFVFGNFRTVLFMILMFCAGRDMYTSVHKRTFWFCFCGSGFKIGFQVNFILV